VPLRAHRACARPERVQAALYRGARYGSLGGGTSETLRDLIGKRLLADIDDTDALLGLVDA
jgi:hypothetical protein